MLQELFSYLSRALEANPFWALGASFIWGILSVILSPCHLASIPLIVGFILGSSSDSELSVDTNVHKDVVLPSIVGCNSLCSNSRTISEQKNASTRRAFSLSVLFATGILSTIGLVGLVTAGLGRMLGDIGPYGNYIVAIIFFLVGLHLLGVIPMPWSGPSQAKSMGKGHLTAFLLGLIFGIAIGPCTFAYMAPVLAVTFKIGSSNFIYAVTLLLVYGLGHCAVIVAAGTSTKTVQSYLNWSDASRGTVILKQVCGLLVILGGLYLVWTA